MCEQCKTKHTTKQRRSNHQVVRYSFSDGLIQIENQLCDAHHMNFSLYCFNEEQPICLGCNSVEAAIADAIADEDEAAKKKAPKSAHEGHFVKSIKEVMR